MNKKILFLTPYPQDTAGSQRFRFEQYVQHLQDQGFEYHCQSFLDQNTWDILYKEGFAIRKTLGILFGFLRRFAMLFTLPRYDFVFIHREAAPLGPPVIEWCVAKFWRKPMIYDFDDAIWFPITSKENSIIGKLKFTEKVKHIISWSYKVSAGNQYLSDYAKIYNKNVSYNPTTIDTSNRHLPHHKANRPLVIGWTGTHSTLMYLEILREPLVQLSEEREFELLIIADKPPVKNFPNQHFICWNKETEIEDLNRIDIGLMPLTDDPWAKGKCGFKALQFMAMETPVLVSPVGVNQEIVEPGVHGYHCEEAADWLERLRQLMDDENLRSEFGKAGRKKVIESFSVQSNMQNFLSLFD